MEQAAGIVADVPFTEEKQTAFVNAWITQHVHVWGRPTLHKPAYHLTNEELYERACTASLTFINKDGHEQTEYCICALPFRKRTNKYGQTIWIPLVDPRGETQFIDISRKKKED